MGINNKRVKKSKEPKSTVKTTLSADIENEKPIILFTHFNGYSIKINGFNNYYSNSVKSINAVYSFIDKIKNIQQKTIKELASGKTKKQLHFHPIEDSREIERINDVLLNGYSFSIDMVMNFENSYYEFSLDNGSRVIFVKIDNIFELLFIDNNHMIYKESSKFLKHKENYEYPSCLGKIDFLYDYDEKNVRDVIEIMITAYENGEINDLKDFVDNLKELIDDYVDTEHENNLQTQ